MTEEQQTPTETPETNSDELSYPRLSARTQRFTLGQPRSFTVSPDGSRVVFLRSASGTDPAHGLWVLDVDSGAERLVADPGSLLGGSAEELSASERARRERSRESGAGVVGYATDDAVTCAAFALSGQLWLAELEGGAAPRTLPAQGPVIDPRPSPDGRLVGYAVDGALRVTAADGTGDRPLAEPEGANVVWGQAEFVAAEEMSRSRGFWWAPDGGSMLAERYDETPVQVWHIADPAHPAAKPRAVRYPAAGTANANVSLWLLGLDGTRRQVTWDSAACPYLVTVSWTASGPPLLLVMSRDQASSQVLAVDVESATSTVIRADSDDCWLEVVPGVPVWLRDGRLLTTVDDGDTRRLAIDGAAVTPAGLQVREVLGVDESGVLVGATTEPTELHLVRVSLPDGVAVPLTTNAGVHSGRAGGSTVVVSSAVLDADGVTTQVHTRGGTVLPVGTRTLLPPFRPRVALVSLGRRELRAAVVRPRDHEPGSGRLPVLLDPYGGPHGLRAIAASRPHLESQWFADQGFAVIVADGRGTPGRGPAWERAVHHDFGVTLDDQVDALHAAAERDPDLDLSRVAIRGWSFGGYLAAMAVFRRPDVFHAAVAGAPVVDQRLYDTFYTERYLGHPDEHPHVYEANSLLADAAALRRPLMLIHGLADDNVVVAHSLALSAALLAAGCPHTLLPLTGVTHMTPQEVVAENLLRLQLHFLRGALAAPD